MSVINKMLRDLDARNFPAGNAARGLQDGLHSTSGIQGVAALPAAARANPVPRLLVVAGGLAVLGFAAWWWQHGAPASESHPALPTPSTLPQSQASASAVTALPATVVAAESVPSAAPANAVVEAHVPAPRTQEPNAEPTPSRVKTSKTSKIDANKAVASAPVVPNYGSAVSTAMASQVSAAESVPTSGRQLQAGREALLQAQVLWNSGSHDAAMDLLQQALSVVERSVTAPTSQAQTAVMAPLARELGRMLVADGRSAAAIDLLS